MLNFILTRDENTGRVPYFFRNDDKHPVAGYTTFESAMWMLRQGKVHVSSEFDGYPLTSDDKYFFAGAGEEPETVEIGADGAPIPAGDGEKKLNRKPTRRKKDEVCE